MFSSFPSRSPFPVQSWEIQKQGRQPKPLHTTSTNVPETCRSANKVNNNNGIQTKLQFSCSMITQTLDVYVKVTQYTLLQGLYYL